MMKNLVILSIHLTNYFVGALLTVSWPKGSWLPAPRPYTPISSSGMSSLFN